MVPPISNVREILLPVATFFFIFPTTQPFVPPFTTVPVEVKAKVLLLPVVIFPAVNVRTPLTVALLFIKRPLALLIFKLLKLPVPD